MAELKRRQRDSVERDAKRRSIATCSTRDKGMEGVALESALQNVLMTNFPLRRPARPTSTHGSPNNGSLSEMTSQTNAPSRIRLRGASFRARETGRKEWNSAAELRVNPSPNKVQTNDGDKGGDSHEEVTTASSKEDFGKCTQPTNVATNVSSPVRTSSTAAKGDEDLLDNNEEEAQKLREASKKVFRFQSSRGSSVSSGEYPLENQKSPAPAASQSRHRTFDEDAQSLLAEQTNEDLVKLLLDTQFPKRNTGRRQTVSTTKVPKTEEEEDNLWAKPPDRTSNPVARDKAKLPPEGSQLNPSKQALDFTDVSFSFQIPAAQVPSSPSAETKNTPSASSGQSQRNNENSPPKTTWLRTETSGLFYSLFKRLGDMSKLQNKDTSHKGSGV